MSGPAPSHKADPVYWARALEACLRGTDIALLQLQLPGLDLRLQRDPARQATRPVPSLIPHPHLAVAPATPATPPAPASPGPCQVRAASVGLLRLAHPLHAQPLVRPGQAVGMGQALALLQIGSIMLPVLSPCAGRVGRVLAQDGQRVGYGSVLLEIETDRKQERPNAD